MAITAQAREIENSLAENASALGQTGQNMAQNLQDTNSYKSITTQPLYMNTLPRATGISVPVAESTPVPHIGPTLFRPIPTPHVHDILEPSSNEQARADYLDRQMRHMKSVQLPSSIPTSNDIPIEEDDLSKRIRDYCSRIEDHRRYEKDTHYVTLNSIKEYKDRQRQQGKKDRDEVYHKMSQNLERVREVARKTYSGASTISAEEQCMTLLESDFINIKEKMNKIDQRIDGLYQNWQVEYKEAITTEQCEEIQKFYEPYVLKYETKYKVLYQILKQHITERTKVPFSKVSSIGLTPSLVALEDASTLKRKEWSWGEPSEDMHQMYTTIGGSLIPTAPVYGDMQADFTLNVTTDMPTTVEGVGERESTQPAQDVERGSIANVAPPPTDVPETSPKVIPDRSSQEELPSRDTISRENSRVDALAATRCFFSAVNEERVVTEVPTTTGVDEPQIDAPSESSIHDEIEPTEPEIPSVRTFLPSGLPSRPTATATCRPRTWVECILEGQIEEHSREDGDSEDSAPLEPLVLESLPDELGPEWRVLHPFEIPGVRFPTEDTSLPIEGWQRMLHW